MSQELWDGLDATERKFVSLAVRAKSDRQIAQQLGTTPKYVSNVLCRAKKKLKITGDSKRALTHWYWTQGPGDTERRLATLQDALRELTISAAGIQAYHKKLQQAYGHVEPEKVRAN